ncbi:MAG: hypothetical protein BJ554DRAFT_7526, partial [Olpidium bornovanus]
IFPAGRPNRELRIVLSGQDRSLRDHLNRSFLQESGLLTRPTRDIGPTTTTQSTVTIPASQRAGITTKGPWRGFERASRQEWLWVMGYFLRAVLHYEASYGEGKSDVSSPLTGQTVGR